MKCFSLVAATTVAALFLAVGVATAAAPTFPTTITFDAFTGPDENATFDGRIDSGKIQCLAKRTVKAYKDTGLGSFELFDTDQTSGNGAWAVRGNVSGTPPVKFKVTKKNIGTKAKPKYCLGDTIVLS